MAQNTTSVTPAMIKALVPFVEHLQVEFPTLTADKVIATLPEHHGYGTVGGAVHGGAQLALADIAAAVMAILANGDPTAAPATAQSSTNFLAPARGELTAEATVVRPGRLSVIDVTITDATGTTAAIVRQVVTVRPPPASA